MNTLLHALIPVSPASTDTARKSYMTSQGQEDVPHAGLGSVEAGTSAKCKSCGAPLYALYDSCTQCLTTQVSEYPVTCRARYYDAASRILEEEGQIWTHDNADELGHVIQKWIEETRNNWEPR